MFESLCCIPETNIVINYTSVKKYSLIEALKCDRYINLTKFAKNAEPQIESIMQIAC